VYLLKTYSYKTIMRRYVGSRVVSSHPTVSYRGADKSLARPTSRYTLFDGENISFDASLVIYIFMIINRMYETQNLLLL
jgi:hypothetical protein